MSLNKAALSPDLGPNERSYVYSVAMKYVRDENEAEDVTQEALLLAHRYRHSFRGDSRYSTWLYRIACTTALMHLRRKKRLLREVASSQLGDLQEDWLSRCADSKSVPEARVAAAEDLRRVAQSVNNMGKKYDLLFWLRYAQGYSESEVARLLGLPLTTVKTRAFRARRHVLDECARAA
jgi:RNA polymerase sigma-70 factor (ECF subfamily)